MHVSGLIGRREGGVSVYGSNYLKENSGDF